MGRDNGVTDEKLLDLGHYGASPHFSERERMALEYTDRITVTSEDVDDELFGKLQAEYLSEEIVELTCTIAFQGVWPP